MDNSEPLDTKDITQAVVTTGYVDLDAMTEPGTQPEPSAPAPAPEPEENALVDVIDVGLDIAEDMLKDAGYPALKRATWEEHGKKALSRALNEYMPKSSPAGNMLDSAAVALIIGIGTLVLCFAPVILKIMRERKEEPKQAAPAPAPEPAPIEYEVASTKAQRPASTAPVSRGDNLAAWDRVTAIIAAQQV